MKRFITLFLFIFGLMGCTSLAPVKDKVAVTISKQDPRIGTYVSTGDGFFTSSYWIEGPEGLILIDTQFLLSAAEEMLNFAEAITGKKVVMAIVLHPNPDKFNGAEILNKRGIKVITSEQVLKLIPSVHELRTKWFYERFKPDYPSSVPILESFGAQTTELEAAGLKLKAHVLGEGCSDAHVVVEFDGHLFPGDLVTNDFHSWLELGHIDAWIERIAELKKLRPTYVHPGRGATGTVGLLWQEEQYLKNVRSMVRAEIAKGHSRERTYDSIKAQIFQAYPGYLYPRFVVNGLRNVIAKQRAIK